MFSKGSEVLTLYADVLFAINFSMDFLAMFICSIILHIKTTRKRIILAAVLGGAFGVLVFTYFKPSTCFFIARKVSFEITCSILQASSAAVFFDTPSFSRHSESIVCRSNMASAI